MQPLPAIAIVGRPNVGKSTLFNRLVGRRQAIVHNKPGVTRDRIVGQAKIGGERPVEVIDTGGLQLGGDELGLNEQVRLAIDESQLLLWLVDGSAGPLPADLEILEELRRLDKPLILVVNKGDTRAAREGHGEFYSLGVAPLVLVSAEHGTGIQELHDRIGELLPALAAAVGEESAVDRLAIVGRPNVGKSSLLNRILGEPRTLVSPMPGTTRDPVDTVVTVDDRTYQLVDTAGIRRRSRVQDSAEEIAVMMARRQLARADLALLVIDAEAGVTTGDLAIAGAAWELGRCLVVVVNKWDLLDEKKRQDLEDDWPALERLAPGVERINTSALTGRGVDKIFPAVARVLAGYDVEFPTAHLNQLVERALFQHQPPIQHGRAWKVYYATQTKKRPPTLILFANWQLPRKESYYRYMENTLRRELELAGGVPLRLVIRRRK